MKEEIDTKFDSLSLADLLQHKNGAEQIKTILLNIEEETRGALSRKMAL
jgi:hypothetical protein